MVWAAIGGSIMGFAVLGLAQSAVAADLASTNASAGTDPHPFLFRHIFVPQSNVEAWPTSGNKYIPIEAAEFEALVKSANGITSSQSVATIEAAEYTAILEESGAFHGRGQWNISLRGSGPAFLPLPDLSLAIHEPRWQSAAQEPVRLGSWGSAGGAVNHYGIEVVRSGILEFEWTTRNQLASNSAEFPWRVPAALNNRLTVDVSDDLRPTIEGSVLLGSEIIPAQSDAAKPRRRWNLAFGPINTQTIQFTAEAGRQAALVDQVSLHEDSIYSFDERGINLTMTWTLDAPQNLPKTISFPLPPGAEFLSAAAVGQELHWYVDRAASTSKVVIEMPSGANGSTIEITSRAWIPLKLDQLWVLPRIRPDAVFWNSGQIRLSVSPRLELEKLAAIDAAQTGASQPGIKEGLTGAEYSFTLFSPTAEVSLRVRRRPPEAEVYVGSAVVLADPDVTARVATRWTVAHSDLVHLSADLAEGWNVETVESVPAGAMAEWFIDAHEGRRRLEIQLSKPAGPGKNLSIVVMGRFARLGIGKPMSADSLGMLKWADARTAHHLLTFQSSEPYTIESIGKLPTVPADSLSGSERELFEGITSDSRIVDLSQADAEAGLQLSIKRGQFTAKTSLSVSPGPKELRQLHSVTVDPKGTPIDRLLVFATRPLGNNVRWMLTANDSPILAERLSAADPQRRDLPAEGELWLLRLPQSATSTVRVTASISSSWSQSTTVPLLCLPEAVDQTGRVEIQAAPANMPSIRTKGLAPLPVASDELDTPEAQETPTISSFGFDPRTCLMIGASPELAITPNSIRGASPLVANYLDLESYYLENGTAYHRATFELSIFGALEFEPDLPTGAEVTSASLDGRSISLASSAQTKVARIQLLPNARSATVSLCFTTASPPLSAGLKLEPPLHQLAMPVLGGQWRIRLPEDFSAQTENPLTYGELRWTERIFGPLARRNDVTPFNPANPSHWARALNSLADWQSFLAQIKAADRQPGQPKGVVFTAPDTHPEIATSSLADAQITEPAPQPSLQGWTSVVVPFQGDVMPDTVTILHPPAVSAGAVAVLFAAFLLGCRLWTANRALVIASLVAAITVAILLPPSIAPFATGAIWGLFFALLWQLPTQALRRTPPAGGHLPRITTSSVLPPSTAIALLIFAAVTTAARADESESNATGAGQPADAKIEQVLIPIDPQRQPVGSKYFVSEEFLRVLYDAKLRDLHRDRQWLLVNAAYSGELNANRSDNVKMTCSLTCAFTVETLAHNVEVVLPLVESEANWQSPAMLDGIPVPIQWSGDKRSCAIQIDQPGRYTLTIYCSPNIKSVSGRRQIRLNIPPLLASTLHLRTPELQSNVRFPGALAVSNVKDQPSEMHAEFGHSNELLIEWPLGDAQTGSTQGLTVSELKWLNVGTEGATLETKYVLEGGSRRPETLTVSYDKSWKLESRPPGSESGAPSADRDRLVVRVPVPADEIDRQEVTLRWNLNSRASTGNFRLPPIELTSIPVTQRWFALSTDSSIDCTLIGNTAAAAVAKEFLTKWGAATAAAPLQAVFTGFDNTQVWSFAARPREIEADVREVLHVAAGLKSIRAVYQADVTPGSQFRYQFGITIPPELGVEEVNVMDSKRPVPIRWTRDESNHINVFFAEEVSSNYRLSLAGTISRPAGEDATVPRINSSAAPNGTLQVQVYREDQVEAQLIGFPPAKEAKSSQTELTPLQWIVRPLGVFQLAKAESDAARIGISPKEAKVSGAMLTQLSRDAGSWQTSISCDLVADSDKVDLLQFRAPVSWAGPFDAESDVQLSVSAAPLDEHWKVVTVRFASEIPRGRRVRFLVRSPFAVPSSAAPVAPEISPLSQFTGRRFLSVPATIDSQLVTWTSIGVKDALIPADLLPKNNSKSLSRQYEIVGVPMHVAALPQTAPLPEPRVRLADVFISEGSRGGRIIRTQFIVSTDGLAQCTLRLPVDQQFISATLDGRPTLVSSVGASTWNVTLGPAQFPQGLEVVSRSQDIRPGYGDRTLARPTLLAENRSIPIDLCLWTVASPQLEPELQVEVSGAVAPVDQAALRFDRLVSIAEAATSAALDARPADAAIWIRPWSQLLAGAERETYELMSRSIAGERVAQVSRPSEEQISRASKRFQQWRQRTGQPAPNDKLADSITSPGLAPSGAFSRAEANVICFISDGQSEQLILPTHRSYARYWSAKLGTLAIIACLSGLAFWLVRTPAVVQFLHRWPHILGVLLGIVYWAWLWPSWLGLVIIAASIWLAVRFNWLARPPRAEASTVLRSTRMQ